MAKAHVMYLLSVRSAVLKFNFWYIFRNTSLPHLAVYLIRLCFGTLFYEKSAQKFRIYNFENILKHKIKVDLNDNY